MVAVEMHMRVVVVATALTCFCCYDCGSNRLQLLFIAQGVPCKRGHPSIENFVAVHSSSPPPPPPKLSFSSGLSSRNRESVGGDKSC